MPFLETTLKKNPRLIDAAVLLHQDGSIPANTLLLDLDAIGHNASLLRAEAARVGLKFYFMTKQYGRNPAATRAAIGATDAKTVAVDIQCARALHYNQLPLGNVGNLCQVPESDLSTMVGRMCPEVVTVFSVSKAESVSRVARASDRRQDLLIRVKCDSDVVFPGMDGGIHLDDLVPAVESMARMPGVRVVGVTSFPSMSYQTSRHPEATANFDTLLRAREIIESCGIAVTQVNVPGNTSVRTLEFMAEKGATHAEPGSALTGHTTLNLNGGASPEIPGAVWVSEVSHFVDGKAWIFGGGLFFDDPPVPELSGFSTRRHALAGRNPNQVRERRFRFEGTGHSRGREFGSIDYHGILDAGHQDVSIGDTVVFGFRTQAFMTRATVAAVTFEGGTRVEGLYDVQGHRLDPDKRW